jgi:hypothetical protein
MRKNLSSLVNSPLAILPTKHKPEYGRWMEE